MKLVLDIETTVKFRESTDTDPSPYLPENKLVMVQYHQIETGNKGALVFDHTEYPNGYIGATEDLQELLNESTEIIGHNLKFDMSWLYECGFKYDGALYDTMIFEYVNNRGLKSPLSLKECCDRYNLPAKLGTMSEYLKQKINVDAMPLNELIEYGMADIESTRALYQYQQELLREDPQVKGMWPAIELMNDTLHVTIEMERNGCFINDEQLTKVEIEYRAEEARLTHLLNDMVAEVMGDTPINLSSPEQLSQVIFSRRLKDKDAWAEIFNLGYIVRNSVKKRRKPKFYEHKQFKEIVKAQCETVYRTEASTCDTCNGSGKIRKIKKDGTEYKKDNICTSCGGLKFIYTPTDKIAGFKVQPLGSFMVSSNGFATDKKLGIPALAESGKLTGPAKEFIDTYQKLNAVSSYLSNFVERIKHNRVNDIFHPKLFQTTTATGRLSSDFHNTPRGNTFPIKRVVQSRFKGGKILECDWSGLEYVTAVLLSADRAGIESILQKKDRHKITAQAIFGDCNKELRQQAKAHTFKPLYGGTQGTADEMRYYKLFTQEHADLYKYQLKLCANAITFGFILSPSGRIYSFPGTRRVSAEYVTNQTQIFNYCIQGFATADIMPCALISLYKLMKEHQVKSKLILTVHDSVEVDVYPDEEGIMIELVYRAFSSIEAELKRRFNFDCCVPLGFEMSIGDNWMDKKDVHFDPTTRTYSLAA